MNFLRKHPACLLAALLTAACASAPPASPPQAAAGAEKAGRAAKPAERPATPRRPATPASKPGETRTTVLDFENNVYFAVGSTRLDARGRSTLQPIGARLKAERELRVALTGHTDHLGSSEYNLALGQKRVDVVVRELIALGAWSRQIVQRTSYGNELGGEDDCRSEECRQADRRVELQLVGGNEKTDPPLPSEP